MYSIFLNIVQKFLLILCLLISFCTRGNITLLNSSYDTGRELFSVINESFVGYWKENHPDDDLIIHQSHAASTRQAATVLQGLPADVVTYNQVTDIQILYDRGKMIPCDWQMRLPNNSSPFYSTIAFLVREGNPKKIHNWDDLVSQDLQIVFPNPKTSGNGRYIYLAALGVISQIDEFHTIDIYSWMLKFLRNVLVFDIGSRGAAATFIDREQGDVLITFESEANTICQKYSFKHYEIVVPKKNILAEFPVTWIDTNIRKRGTEEVAKAYLQYLYSKEAQKIIGAFYYRVIMQSVMDEYSDRFPDVELFRVEDKIGNWDTIMCVHFSRGGELDKLLAMRYSN